MKQITFVDAGYAGKRKQTRKELFLIEMDQVVHLVIEATMSIGYSKSERWT